MIEKKFYFWFLCNDDTLKHSLKTFDAIESTKTHMPMLVAQKKLYLDLTLFRSFLFCANFVWKRLVMMVKQATNKTFPICKSLVLFHSRVDLPSSCCIKSKATTKQVFIFHEKQTKIFITIKVLSLLAGGVAAVVALDFEMTTIQRLLMLMLYYIVLYFWAPIESIQYILQS